MPKSVYRQRNPQNSPYYQCVEDHFETFELLYDETPGPSIDDYNIDPQYPIEAYF